LRRGRSLPLTTAPKSHAPAAFAAMPTAAQWAAIQQLPKSCAMAKATHTAMLAVGYFLAPFALCFVLIAIGTFTGYSFTTNLLIDILAVCGLFVGLVLICIRKYRIKALMLICSVSLIEFYVWHFGHLSSEEPIRRYLYAAEVLMTPHFDKKCVPSDGVLFNGDTLRLCSTYDFGDYAELIVKISGSYPTERLIDDINSRKMDPQAGGDELMKLGIWLNSVIGHHLVSDYYLFTVYECGKGQPYCGPLG
jgi:hypothetical protein